MKTCSYCGRENPDDATVCLVDGKPLGVETPIVVAKPSRSMPPRPKPSREEVLAHLAARPWEVNFAVGLLALDLIFEMISEAVHWWPYHRYLNSHYPDSVCYFIVFVCFYGIYFFLYYRVYHGKNRARWLISCLLVLGSISIPFIYHHRLGSDFYLHAVIEFIAIVALFQPPSNDWFEARKKIWNQPVPPTET